MFPMGYFQLQKQWSLSPQNLKLHGCKAQIPQVMTGCNTKWSHSHFHPLVLGLTYFTYCCLVAKSCLTLCDLMDCSQPGSSVHGISQARILEWAAISFSRDFPNLGIEPMSPALAGGLFTTEPPDKPILPIRDSQNNDYTHINIYDSESILENWCPPFQSITSNPAS